MFNRYSPNTKYPVVYVASCPICDKKFNLTSAFRDHMRIHTGEKPFECDLCDQAFPTEAGLGKLLP